MRVSILVILLFLLSSCASSQPDRFSYMARQEREQQIAQSLDAVGPDGCKFNYTKQEYECDTIDPKKINDRVGPTIQKLDDLLLKPRYDNKQVGLIFLGLYGCKDLNGKVINDNSRTWYCETEISSVLLNKMNEEVSLFKAGMVDDQYKYILSEK